MVSVDPTIVSPRVAIEYCTRCNWMLRSAWMAQELLTTFNGTIGEVALIPNHEEGGIFQVTLLTSSGASLLWNREHQRVTRPHAVAPAWLPSDAPRHASCTPLRRSPCAEG